jgi:hypothetical protein
MSHPVLTGSARTVQALRIGMSDVAAIDRVMRVGLSPLELKAIVAKPLFRAAFEMWQEAAR